MEVLGISFIIIRIEGKLKRVEELNNISEIRCRDV